MNILLPVDGSPYTDRMLEYIAAHTGLFGPDPRMTLLLVQEEPSLRERAYAARDDLEEQMRSEAAAVLRPAREALARAGVSAAEVVCAGVPGSEIVRYANENPTDMIVMGSHGRSGLSGLLLGSVTNAVLAHSRVPVLVVR